MFKNSGKSVKNPTKTSINKIGMTGAIVAITGIVVVLGFIFQWITDYSDKKFSDDIRQAKNMYVGNIVSLLQMQQTMVEAVAEDGRINDLLLDPEHAGLAKLETDLLGVIPNVIRVNIILSSAEQNGAGEFPLLGFSDLELMHELQKGASHVPYEAHLIGSANEHYDILSEIKADFSDSSKAYLLVSYPLGLLKDALEMNHVKQSYIEVRQSLPGLTPVKLFSVGDKALASAGFENELVIRQSRWKIYAGFGNNETLVSIKKYFIGIFISVVIFLSYILFLMVRSMNKMVGSDLNELLEVTGDAFLNNKIKPTYNIKTQIFSEAVDKVIEINVETETKRNAEKSVKAVDSGELSSGIDVIEHEVNFNIDNVGDMISNIYDKQPKVSANVGLSGTIFKAYDIRGVVNQTLTDSIVYDIGRAIGSEAYARGQQSIVVARDGRLSGPGFIKALRKGLCDSGRDVIDIGCVPTPVLYFATHFLNTGSGIMVTGSHNPPDYNGFKIMLSGDTLSGHDIKNIEKRIRSGNFLKGHGGQETLEINTDYIDRIISDISLKRPLSVVVDCGNGAAGEMAPRLLRSLGCEVTELFCEIDGNFPNHHPDPSKPENLEDLIHKVKEIKADIGLAFDGDGDRLGVVDSDGLIIWPDRQMMLYAADILSRHPGAEIIYDVKCSTHLADVITQHGGVPLMWKTGHSLIKAKMKESGDLLAGEMSGHIFFKERWYGFDDGLYTAARLLEILAMNNRPTGEVFAELPNAINTPELNVLMDEGDHFKFMDKMMESAVFENAEVITIDGLRVNFKDGWGLVRASNTTPSLVLRFEANNLQTLNRIQEIFKKMMLEIDSDIKIPF